MENRPSNARIFVILHHTHFNHDGLFFSVTNVITNVMQNVLSVTHSPSMIMMEFYSSVTNVITKVLLKSLSKHMTSNHYGEHFRCHNYINVITTVLQNNHMSVTHSTIMMGSNTHVVNVIPVL